MSTLITPNDGTLATFTLARDPDRGERVGLAMNDRQLVSAGGVLDVLNKGPVSQSFPLRFSGLNRKEYEKLDAYIRDTLIGGVKTFRIQFGVQENLLTRTIRLGEDPPWQLFGTSSDPVATYPASVLAPDFSRTALQLVFLDGATTGANQKLHSYARVPEGVAVTAAASDDAEFGVWARTTTGAGLPASAHRIRIVTDGEDSTQTNVTLTDVWQWFSNSHTFSGSGANLGVEFGVRALTTGSHTVYLWQPQLRKNITDPPFSSGTYQTVPEADYGHIDVKFGDPALHWREALDETYDVTLNIFRVGSG